jgi:UDP-glucuronate decarboxylase
MTGFIKVLLQTEKPDVFNVGNPLPEISISDLAQKVCEIAGDGAVFELSKYPDSYPEDEPNRRCPDIDKIRLVLNFEPKINLDEGLSRFLKWAKENYTEEIL